MDSVNFLNLDYVFLRIFEFFKNFDIIAILNAIIHFIEAIRPLAIIITLVLIYVIIYSNIRLKQLAKEDEAKFQKLHVRDVVHESGTDPVFVQKWEKIQAHINSLNPSDWRLAILEADIMLGDALEKKGYQGDSIGDRLKTIDQSDFLNLQSAWEAHKVRNQIAHEGADFLLNDREARRVIELYERVFKEFMYI